MAGIGTGDQTWELDARNIMYRIDHNFSPNFRLESQLLLEPAAVGPELRRRGWLQRPEFDPETESAKNTDYYGSGFFQRISTHHAHQQFDWIIKPNLLSHSTVAWDRWFMGGNHLSAGANWPARLWQGTSNPTGGLVAQDAGTAHDAVQRRDRFPTPRSASKAGRVSATRRTIAGSSRTT